jgi:prepilin-type N-terminal cleavage/methylation domain-containing protein
MKPIHSNIQNDIDLEICGIRHASGASSGFTLVELLIVMVLSLVLVGTAFMAYLAQNKTGNEQAKVVALQQDIRAVMDMIDRDMRNSGSNKTGGSILAIDAADSSATSVGFDMDLDWNGTNGQAGENVRYWLSGTTLNLTDQGVTTPLLTNVSQFNVTYFDRSSNSITPTGAGGFLSTAEAANVMSIQVDMILQSADIDPNTGVPIQKRVVRRMQSRNREIIHKNM